MHSFNETIIYILYKLYIDLIIYIFNERIIFIQPIIYIFNELFTYSTKELFSFSQLNILIQQMNWIIFIQPNSHKIYGQMVNET